MNNDFWGIPIMISIAIIGISVIAFIFNLISMPFDAWSCHRRWGESNKHVEYKLFTGCMVQESGGGLVPEDKIRYID